MSARTPQHDVHPQFPARWSPRAYTGAALPQAELMRILEAARWAPSAMNVQPWRFVYGLRGTPAFDALLATAVPNNQGWMRNAGALVLVVSDSQWTPPGQDARQPFPTHAFDTGAAWAYLALQAHLAGWPAHAAGGFDKAAATVAAGLPDGVLPHALVAIGQQADKSVLPEALQAREAPNGRRPVGEIAFEGRYRA